MWLILADDLTGAADCAIAFARRGVGAVVGWGTAKPSGPVFAYDAGSRELPAEATIARHRQLLARLAGRQVFVKIDSTLRGQPAAAIVAALHGDAIGVLAPAFPATGRTTEDGRVRVGGMPLEATELWQRDHGYENADLVAMLATRGVTGHHLSLALADTLPGRTEPMPDRPTSHGTLVVVGSLASVTRDAAQELARLEGVRHVRLAPAAITPDLGGSVATTLRRGMDVLLTLEPPNGAGARTGAHAATALAQMLEPAAAEVGALVATGGETAAALLRAFRIHGIRLYEEPEPGVSLGVTMGAIEVPLATKAGAFGDRETLVRIVRRLRQSRQKGTDA